ncbi:MFS transporter [Mumia sp. ZJ430]|uniref:MFS transporter n=1 Tax=Mumia sp. ZJ430 TaxID=2708083 RepID=UPI00141D997B|nr:MFS transporter [Mumia sp. ZJ430]
MTPSDDSSTHGSGFGYLWLGQGASLVGNATSSFLIPVLAVVHLQAGPLWMGLLTAAAWLPWVVVGLVAGALVDGHPPRAVIVVANLVAAAALLTVPLAGWAGHLTLGHLLVVALTTGTASLFSRAAGIKIVPLVVPPERLERANARLLGTESLTQVAGPGIGGLLVTVVSAATGLLVDVAGFLVSVACMRGVRPRQAARSATAAPVRLRTQIAEGITVVRSDRYLAPFVLIGSVSNFGLTGLTTLLVIYLVNVLEIDASYTGLVMMLGSIGGVLGALVAVPLAHRLGTGRASTGLLLLSGPAALLITLPTSSRHVWITVTGLVLVGATVVSGNVIRGAWRQRYIPARLIGRVVTTSQVVIYGAMPLAGVTAGLLAHEVGTRPTMLAMAGVHALACVAIVLTPIGRLAELPPPMREPGTPGTDARPPTFVAGR